MTSDSSMSDATKSPSSTSSPATAERQWFIVGRWQQFDGESRAGLLRIIAVISFYVVQLVHYYLLTAVESRDEDFHRAATILAASWSLLALGVLVSLRRHYFPAFLPYVSTACDIVLLTALASLGGGGASPLVFAYFLIIALAGLRFQLPLVWAATAGCLLAYLGLVVMRDPDWFAQVARPINVDRTEQLVVLLSLTLTGVIVGQIIRRVRYLAQEYVSRLESQRRETP